MPRIYSDTAHRTDVGAGEIAFAITPHNTNALTAVTRGVYVGVSGNVVATIGGTDVTFVAVPAGMILPIAASHIKATGTTAGSLVGLA